MTVAKFIWGIFLIFAVAAVAIGSESLPQIDRVMVLKEPRAISNAELIDQRGRHFALQDLAGKVSLVFFGFTNCPDVCPAAMAKFRQLEMSGDLDLSAVNLVLISVDGERDSPAVMKTYLDGYSKRIIGLTSHPDKVRPITKEFRAPFYKGGPSGGGYSVAHSNQMFLLDKKGMLRAELHNPPIESISAITSYVMN
jgi:protein SCO1/2